MFVSYKETMSTLGWGRMESSVATSTNSSWSRNEVSNE